MDILQFLSTNWHIIILIVVVIFNIGINTQKMKAFVTKAELNEKVEEALIDHCPFSKDIEALKKGEEKSSKDIINVHTKLHQIDFNVQNICEKLDVNYIGKKNGS